LSVDLRLIFVSYVFFRYVHVSLIAKFPMN